MYDICVIGGAGHVGLPLSIAFADRGKRVAIYDINTEDLEKIRKGNMPFIEEGAETVLRKVINSSLFIKTKIDVISDSKFIIVVIGTPIDEHLNPSVYKMKLFIKELLPYLRNEQIVILRSTVYPGTTQIIRDMLKEQYPGIEVVLCPERILEGKAMEELYSLPQIISGYDEKAINKVRGLFELLTTEIIQLEVLEAELAKLFTNSWRYIQFAIANQFYMIANEYGADFYDIFKAMTYKYPRAEYFPTPGFAAGPCLFKDTMQLSAFSKNSFFLGHSAMLINEGLPNFIVENLKTKFELKEKVVGILGMAFKAESDDKRDSLSYKLKKILEIESKRVLCSDAYFQDSDFVNDDILIDKSDIIIIGAPHNKYRTLNYKNKILFDVWNIIG